MPRKPVMAGNWKLNKTVGEAVDLVGALKKSVGDVTGVDVIVCPTFTALYAVSREVDGTNIAVGGQDVFFETSGAFTGEVSPEMLKDVGASYVIIGHSERRAYFHETDETVNKKIKASFGAGLTPIVCVGESLKERENDQTQEVLTREITKGLVGFEKDTARELIIAYEPIWAIGTGKPATEEDANSGAALIRTVLARMFDDATAEAIRILYGGSVKPNNVSGFMAMPQVDGALVGGASLKADSFTELVKAALV